MKPLSPKPEDGNLGGGVTCPMSMLLCEEDVALARELLEESAARTTVELCDALEDCEELRRASRISRRLSSNARKRRLQASSAGFAEGSKFAPESVTAGVVGRPARNVPVPTRSHQRPLQTIELTF